MACNTTVLRCFLLGLGLYLVLAADFSIDLRTGQWTGGGDYLLWEIPPYQPTEGSGLHNPCRWQAVLRLTFHKKLRRRAEIRMAFENSTLFSFNLGDSSTNDGWSGDDGTQSNNAEVHSYDDQMVINGRDDGQASYGILYRRRGFVEGNLTLEVSDQFVEMVNEQGVIHYNSKELFALRGQRETLGDKNYDLFLSMNRVVKNNTYRQGAGLCSLDITWHKR